MVDAKSISDQLKRISFNARGWNHPETLELAAIILPDEQIFECVNGWYEGGVALLCATDIRILLVDKKPLSFLTVEDLRFDMINQIDYSHRLFNASIVVSTGMKTLRFRSYNQQRLRKLIGHVQHRMAEIKIEESTHTQGQQEHLKQIDQQLQTYLLAQYQQHESMRRQLSEPTTVANAIGPRPSISDQPIGELISGEYNTASDTSGWADNWAGSTGMTTTQPKADSVLQDNTGVSTDELYQEGVKEIFSNHTATTLQDSQTIVSQQPQSVPSTSGYLPKDSTNGSLDINPLKNAYSKLLRYRQYGKLPLQTSVSQSGYE